MLKWNSIMKFLYYRYIVKYPYIWYFFLVDHNYWIGMTDLKKEGEFLWTYDKSKAVLKDWFPQYGSRGNRFNCVGLSIHEKRFKPFDTRCNTLGYRYVCESDVCK